MHRMLWEIINRSGISKSIDLSRVTLLQSSQDGSELGVGQLSKAIEGMSAPQNALILSSSTPGKVLDDGKSEHSPLVAELLSNMNTQGLGAEQVFNRTRIAVSRKSDGQQVPTVSSSLIEEVRFGTTAKSGS